MSLSDADNTVALLKAENARLRSELAEMRAATCGDATETLLMDAIGHSVETLEFTNASVPGRVTVIIPAFNAAPFIERAIRSVWAQTLDTERIELLVVDDGSHDETRAICARLALDSPLQMHLLKHPDSSNRGVSASRQLACREASGEFIALLDADDLFLPERLLVGVEALQASAETAAVCSLGMNVDMEGNPVHGHNGTLVAGDWVGLEGDFAPPFTFEQLWRADPIANSSLTLRRSAMQEIGGYPALMAHQSEDWLLVLKLSLLSPIPCIEQQLIHYTHHPQAYTTQYNQQGLHAGARFEVFYQLAWWMLHSAGHVAEGRRFFRREYPRLIADHQHLLPLLRDYVQLGGHAADGMQGVEEYVRRLYDETMTLRRVTDAKLSENRTLRDLLGREPGRGIASLDHLLQECETLQRVLMHVRDENRRLRHTLQQTPPVEQPND